MNFLQGMHGSLVLDVPTYPVQSSSDHNTQLGTSFEENGPRGIEWKTAYGLTYSPRPPSSKPFKVQPAGSGKRESSTFCPVLDENTVVVAGSNGCLQQVSHIARRYHDHHPVDLPKYILQVPEVTPFLRNWPA